MSKKVSQPNPRNKSVRNRPLAHTQILSVRENARLLVRDYGYRLMNDLITRRANRLMRIRGLESIERELTAGHARDFITVGCAGPEPHAAPKSPPRELSKDPIDLAPDLLPCRPPRLTKANGPQRERRTVDRLFAKQAISHRLAGTSWI